MKKSEARLQDLWDNIKVTNICVIRVPEGEEKEKGEENLFEEIMTENFFNLETETVRFRKPREVN